MDDREAAGEGMKSMWRLAAIVVSALTFTACGGHGAVTTVTPKSPQSPAATPTPAIAWSQTAAPQGVKVAGAEWLQIEGAGGTSANVQVAAVLRPKGPGPFPLVVWFHGGLGFHVLDISKAARVTASGFMVLVGCWQYTNDGVTVYDGVSYQNIPCLQMNATDVDAAKALIEVGHQLPGVKTDAIGLFGGSSSGPLVLDYVGAKTDVKAVVVDSSPCGPLTVTVPVLMLGGTADPLVPVRRQQECEQTLRTSGGTVESHYYQGGGHGVTYFGNFQADAMRRTIDFFKRYLV